MNLPATLSAVLIAATLSGAAAAQQIESVEVRGNIHMLTGDGGNIGVLIGADGTFMIDDKFAPLTEAILAKVGELGGDTPKFLINTHYHGDHTGGNGNLGKAGTLIVAHENVRNRLAEGTNIKAFDIVTPAQGAPALPVITFTRDMRFHLNGQTVDIVHLPAAHTDGDSFVHIVDANVIHTGDVVFNGFYPFIDVDHGGTVKGVIAAVDMMLALSDDDTRIIPGHGPLASRQDLVAYRNMLVIAQERLGTLRTAGKSVDEAVAEKPLADLEAEWGDGNFTGDRWIALIYEGV